MNCLKELNLISVQRLYPQYISLTDRRKQTVPVAFERRSGLERRSQDRVAMDTKLTRDIFEVKSRISQFQSIEPVSFSKNITKAAINSLKSDQFIKTTKNETLNLVNKSKDNPAATVLLGGILSVGLVGAMAGAFFGPAAGVVALGFGAYLGGKVLKQAIVSQVVDDEKSKTSKK